MFRRRRLRKAALEPVPIDCEEDEGLVDAMASMFQETRHVSMDVARRMARFCIYGRTEPVTKETPC